MSARSYNSEVLNATFYKRVTWLVNFFSSFMLLISSFVSNFAFTKLTCSAKCTKKQNLVVSK